MIGKLQKVFADGSLVNVHDAGKVFGAGTTVVEVVIVVLLAGLLIKVLLVEGVGNPVLLAVGNVPSVVPVVRPAALRVLLSPGLGEARAVSELVGHSRGHILHDIFQLLFYSLFQY